MQWSGRWHLIAVNTACIRLQCYFVFMINVNVTFSKFLILWVGVNTKLKISQILYCGNVAFILLSNFQNVQYDKHIAVFVLEVWPRCITWVSKAIYRPVREACRYVVAYISTLTHSAYLHFEIAFDTPRKFFNEKNDTC